MNAVNITTVERTDFCFRTPPPMSSTTDAMTATVENVPFELLKHITDRILTEVNGVNRVLYDMSPKPIATIEWE